jgi:hypothetical protein
VRGTDGELAEEKSMQETILLICEELLKEAERLASSDEIHTNKFVAGEQAADSSGIAPEPETSETNPILLKFLEQRGSQRMFMAKPFSKVTQNPEGIN